MKLPPLQAVTAFLLGGFAAQAASAIAGLLLVRYMSVGGYAIYTIGVTMIGAIALLTRGGVQLALAARLAKVWPDRVRAAEAVSGAFRIRVFVSAITLPPILIASWLLLDRADAEDCARIAILGILTAYWLADARGAIIDQVLFFDGKAVKVQMLDTVLALLRVASVLVLQFSLSITAVLALMTNFLPVAVRVPFVRSWVKRSLKHTHALAPRETVREMKGVAMRQLPIDLFTVLQAQVAIFFLTRNGGGAELATFGALSRFSLVLTPFASLSLAYFVPMFASVRKNVLLVVLKFAAIGALSGIVLSLWAWIAPETLLFFLGPSYAQQSGPLLVFAIALTFTNTVQVIWSLVSHRGWNHWWGLRIVLGLVWMGIAPNFIAVDTASGSYIFNCGFAVVTLLVMALELLSAQRSGEISFGPHLKEN